MPVAVRGRIPWEHSEKFTEKAAIHIQERLQALERALAGGAPIHVSPSTPTFGSGTLPSGGSGGGGGSGSGTPVGVTDHGLLTGLLDDDHPQYVEHGEAVKPHQHGPHDVAELETRFVQHFETVRTPHSHGADDVLGLRDGFVTRFERLPFAHTHTADEIQGADPKMSTSHGHTRFDIADLHAGDADFVFAARVFGG